MGRGKGSSASKAGRGAGGASSGVSSGASATKSGGIPTVNQVSTGHMYFVSFRKG